MERGLSVTNLSSGRTFLIDISSRYFTVIIFVWEKLRYGTYLLAIQADGFFELYALPVKIITLCDIIFQLGTFSEHDQVK